MNQINQTEQCGGSNRNLGREEPFRVLLVQPPIHKEALVLGTMEPLGLLVLAAHLPPDVSVQVLDMRVSGGLERVLRRYRPDVVGVTGNTMDVPEMIRVIELTRRVLTDCVVVVGGHHASVSPATFYRDDVDGVVRGPGTVAFPALVTQLRQTGVISAVTGVAVRTPSGWNEADGFADGAKMRGAPLPRRDLVQRVRRRYRFAGYRAGLITTSAGCPSRCSFCACWTIMQGRYVCRDPDEVVAELSLIPERRVFIGDDHTFGNVKRAWKLYELIKAAGINKRYEAYCRADTIVKHPDLMAAWASIGLDGLTVGFEGISDGALSQYNKGADVATNERANDILRQLGITNYAHMLVRPDFTKRQFDEFADYGRRLGLVHPVYPVLTPLPGTVYRQEVRSLRVDAPQYYDLAHPLLPTTLSIPDFYRALKRLYLKNYSWGRYLRALAYRFKRWWRSGQGTLSAKGAAPSLWMTGVMQWMVRRQFRPAKIRQFASLADPPSDGQPGEFQIKWKEVL